MYDVFVGASKVDLNMKGILYKNRKMMTEYEGLDGWRKFITMMMLEDYTNDAMEPKPIFNQVWCSMKGITREDYLRHSINTVHSARNLSQKEVNRL